MLRFYGATESDRGRLVEELKQSGCLPKDEEVESDFLFIGSLMRGTIEEKRQQIRQEKGIDPDRAWHKALKFYDGNGNRVGAD